MTMQIHTWADLGKTERQALLRRPALADDAGIRTSANTIVTDVRENGDAALQRFTKKYDDAEISVLQVSDAEFSQAESALTSDQLEAIDLAIDNVRKFHLAQVTPDVRVETMPGVVCER